jgi:hypothetical protein
MTGFMPMSCVFEKVMLQIIVNFLLVFEAVCWVCNFLIYWCLGTCLLVFAPFRQKLSIIFFKKNNFSGKSRQKLTNRCLLVCISGSCKCFGELQKLTNNSQKLTLHPRTIINSFSQEWPWMDPQIYNELWDCLGLNRLLTLLGGCAQTLRSLRADT